MCSAKKIALLENSENRFLPDCTREDAPQSTCSDVAIYPGRSSEGTLDNRNLETCAMEPTGLQRMRQTSPQKPHFITGPLALTARSPHTGGDHAGIASAGAYRQPVLRGPGALPIPTKTQPIPTATGPPTRRWKSVESSDWCKRWHPKRLPRCRWPGSRSRNHR